ncbi:MAG: ABC transporter ATP-binding protein [Bacilli bacterium]|nr:ABC transporter ATP-binding protein [Bacilli bacterium]
MAELIVSHLSKIYNEGKENEVRALDNVSFSLRGGEFAVILGSSGAGKSTLLNLLGGMDVATSGEILLDGEDVASFNAKELQMYRREQVGFVFQFYNLMPSLNALENVQLASSVAKEPFDALEILEAVGLSGRKSNFPSTLSGGEQQRVSIARAIVKNPALLLCDEPTGALDSKTGASVLKLLSDVSKKYQKTVLIVTHNAKIAECAERVIRLSDGRLIEDSKNPSPKHPEEIVW